MEMSRRKWFLVIGGGGCALLLLVGGTLLLRHRATRDLASVMPIQNLPSTSVTTSSTTDVPSPPTAVTAPLSVDQDGDGLSDEEEMRLGTNPLLTDTDGDGRTDEDEVRYDLTDPLRSNLSVSNIQPINAPSSSTKDATTLRLNIDSDADGVSDQDEIEIYRTDPTNADTDGDTYPDGEEIEKGYNPLGPGRCAQPTCLPSV